MNNKKAKVLEILFRHRANDRGNKDLNLFEDKKELDEQDVYYADEIMKIFEAK